MDKLLIDQHMKQTTSMLAIVPQHLDSLRKAIDQGDSKSIAQFLDLLRADYHHLEGNNATLQRLISKSQEDIEPYLSG